MLSRYLQTVFIGLWIGKVDRNLWICRCLTSRRSQPAWLLRLQFTPRVGGGSAFFVRRTVHLAMKNIQISSPETDHKIARLSSIIFMALAWLFLAGIWMWAFIEGDPKNWGILEYTLVCISALAFLFIPFQLMRYFRDKRRLK
jgi:hypothetical protein